MHSVQDDEYTRHTKTIMYCFKVFNRMIRILYTYAVYRNDLHILVVDEEIWHNELKAGPDIPSPRSHFGFAETSGTAYLFGGVGGTSR